MSKNRITNPLRLSQPAGAALAFMGVKGTVPLWHGVQGCTAFGKILFISHYREPLPFQTTALSQANVVMGSDGNFFEAVENLKDSCELIGVFTTGVAETSGVDLPRLIKEVEAKKLGVEVVGVSTPDFEGTLETGYVKACQAMLDHFTQPNLPKRSGEVGLFLGPYIQPGEVEELRKIVEDFGLCPRIFPDLGDSLLGYLMPQDHASSTIGGTSLKTLSELSGLELLVSVGSSMKEVAAQFGEAQGIETYHYDSLIELSEIDHFMGLLMRQTGKELPRRYLKERRHLQDTLLDVEVYYYDKKVGLLGDPEMITRFKKPLESMGISTFAISPIKTDDYPEGDLEGALRLLPVERPDLLLGNSHVAHLAEDEGLEAIRAGIPVEDRIGGHTWIRLGYRGAAAFYMEVANQLMVADKGVTPYVSTLQATLI
ncbi:MAG: nitrogenase iron-molybdenum cofactor biosynthesis protein NifN [bacterium]|nr:nitrogenase iron-molybdenum cofactor biosynthesis protein NifN [bacterium]